jgi:hypothetical protein
MPTPPNETIELRAQQLDRTRQNAPYGDRRWFKIEILLLA